MKNKISMAIACLLALGLTGFISSRLMNPNTRQIVAIKTGMQMANPWLSDYFKWHRAPNGMLTSSSGIKVSKMNDLLMIDVPNIKKHAIVMRSVQNSRGQSTWQCTQKERDTLTEVSTLPTEQLPWNCLSWNSTL